MKRFAVAIDGPNGAGKSTIAKEIARRLGCVYVDTGAMYRAIALYAMRKGADAENSASVTALLPEIDVSLEYREDGQHVLLNGEDVSDAIRLPEVSVFTSNVAKITEVRESLLERQRKLAREGSVVMDGRDIGTVVLPDAEVKIFLTASAEDRARRRYKELIGRGQNVTFEDVLKDLEWRDKNDATREIAPLRAAEDAIIIDTSGNEFEESVEQVLKTVEEHLNDKA